MTKTGFVEFPRDMLPHHNDDEPETISISLTTQDPNGIIFFHGQPENMDGNGLDHFTIALANGYVTVGYELGNGPVNITWPKYKVSDGKKHNVKVIRTGKAATVQVDDSDVTYGEANGLLRRLNAMGNIYIGKFNENSSAA